MILEGQITAVTEDRAGTELAADAAIGATSILVADADELDHEGGTVAIGDAELVVPELVDYTIANPDELPTGGYTVELATPLVAAAAIETPVLLEPAVLERRAFILADAQEEELEARVPHALYDRLPVGTRDPDDLALTEVAVATLDDEEWVVTDLLDQPPAVDGSFIDAATLPTPEPPEPEPPTDGIPPASSPIPVLRGGIGALVVTWSPIANADPVTYEVHLGTANPLVTSPATLAADNIAGTTVWLRTLPDGTALDYATTYRVKVIAKDADGKALENFAATGSPAQVNTPDIFAEGVTADKILANEALFDKLETLLLVANTIKVPGDTGQRLEFDQEGIRLYDGTGQEVVLLDTGSGLVRVKGEIDFGLTSRLTEDFIDLGPYGGLGTYMTPKLISAKAGSSTSGVTFVASPASIQTSPGNASIVLVSVDQGRTLNTPANWQKVGEAPGPAGSNYRLYMFARNLDTATTGVSFTVTGGTSGHTIIWHYLEWSGLQVGVVADKVGVAQAASGNGSVSLPANTTQNSEALIGAFGANLAGVFWGGAYSAAGQFLNAAGSSESRFRSSYAIQTAAKGWTLGQNISAPGTPWAGILAAFKAKPAGDPVPPEGDHLRLWQKSSALGRQRPMIRDDGGIARTLLQAAVDEDLRVAYGRYTLPFGGTAGVTETFAHGIPGGANLVAGFAGADRAGANASVPRLFGSLGAPSTTEFTIGGRSNNDSNVVGSAAFYWLAIYTPATA